jgi:diguanylate cyclase (GGDEF)-like protein
LDSSSPEEYAADDLRLLDIVASLTSLAMDNAELYQRTKELAIRDNLTGLYVHKYFQDRLEEELKRALIRNYSLSLVMLDLDHFKDYNDRFGHIAGDIVLRHLAKILTKEAAPGNLIARYGGEEFCLLLPRTDKEQAHGLAERVRRKIAGHIITLRRIKTGITASLGVAALPQDARTRIELIRKADEALYRAKEEGNRVCL